VLRLPLSITSLPLTSSSHYAFCPPSFFLPSPLFFFFNTPAPPHSSPLPLHGRSPVLLRPGCRRRLADLKGGRQAPPLSPARRDRSEEHTSELQSLTNLVCRLLLEKKKRKRKY